MGCRAPTISTMLLVSLGALWMYAQVGFALFGLELEWVLLLLYLHLPLAR